MVSIYVDQKYYFREVVNQGIVATIGFFDGVHCGHRFLIEQLKHTAGRSGLPAAVITFPLHPRKVMQSDYQPELLNSFDEKLYQLSTTGVDYCFIMDFTLALSELTAEVFMKEKLRNEFHVKKLLVGYDHQFGRGRIAGFEDYKEYGARCGIEVLRVKQLTEGDLHFSSTTIRKLLATGKMREAAKILTYDYSLSGVVVRGDEVGRTIGFPTANLKVAEPLKVIPSSGVYASRCYVNNACYGSMTYIGSRPTLATGGALRIETHLFDFSGDLYDKDLKIEFIDFLRPNIRFDSIDALKRQLYKDRDAALGYALQSQ
ncbi:MAG: bifunctional riboflavin kinase/FAD synthetase [Dysgonamonadaceae bacterium]|jgi:riboflavin kinase/FMN adenylyltransferase|nr:bifunctional riboflavin kinase/FAD synthetase [Dysgonamonadaceae bacterium]